MHLKNNKLSSLLIIYLGVFILWAGYRFFFKNTVFLEETLIKGIVFSLPLFILPLSVKNKLNFLGITGENFFKSVYLGIILGLVLGLAGQVGNLVRHHTMLFSSNNLTAANIGAFLILSLITAFWEQLLFSGYFLSFATRLFKSEVVQVTLTGLLFSLIHLPALLLVNKITFSQIYLSLLLLLTLGISCSILRLRQKNLIAPIMAHALWGVTIFMFR